MPRRLPVYGVFLLAALMAASYAMFGSFTPSTPQIWGNTGWQKLVAGDIPDAISDFQRALEADPAFPYRWSDLGEALADAGKMQDAAYCFRRAVELAPDSPQIAIRAANFWFRAGSPDRALSLESPVLNAAPEFDQMVFRSWIRMAGDISRILTNGIGTDARAARAFFDFLVSNGERPGLDETWRWLESHGYTAPRQSRERVDLLLRWNAPAEAVEVWANHLAAEGRVYGKSRWVDNGGFERNWEGGGFDWNSVACPGVSVSVDNTGAHSGGRSLRVDFDSKENLDFHHFFQRTWMPPGKYRLDGWIRTSGFTTDQGVGLRAVEPGHESELNTSTTAITGTTSWTHVSEDFVIAGHARLIEIQILRKPSFSFDNHPRGTAWVDDIQVQPAR
jgi:hypothetical protein